MKNFMKKRKFKILMGVACFLLGIIIYSGSTYGYAVFPEKIVSVIVVPIQKGVSSVVSNVGDFVGVFVNAQTTKNENDDLTIENEQLKNQLVEMENLQRENDQFKEYLGLAEANEDFEFVPAFVIGRDPVDNYFSFTVGVGENKGVSFGDPVITSAGLVGYVSEVLAYSSRVKTILDPTFSAGALVVQTRDPGEITGNTNYLNSGQVVMSYLSLSSQTAMGDLIKTSGIGSAFPKDIAVGTVDRVLRDEAGTTLYAVVTPHADIINVKDVLIITSFSEQDSFNIINE